MKHRCCVLLVAAASLMPAQTAKKWVAPRTPDGHPDLQGLCLALSDWSAELKILRDEKRRPNESERREKEKG